jgi:hypothetical protein
VHLVAECAVEALLIVRHGAQGKRQDALASQTPGSMALSEVRTLQYAQ